MSKRKEMTDVMSQLQGLGTASQPPADAPTLPTTKPAIVGARERALSQSLKKRTPKSRLAGRASYDVGYELKQVIEQESINLGVPASQLAKYLLLYAWDFYAKGEIPHPTLQRSTSPKFRNNIEFED
ncbi:MAG: hypothetical protein KJ069_22995 [Anaerolineae bacterium]|nr:hypothetical protein [Anaerolineae bacterium]